MQIAVRILADTPVWVFVLFAYVVWQGAQALRQRTQPIWRVLIVPLVFFLMGLSRLATVDGTGPEPLFAWLVAAVLFAWLGLSRQPRMLAAGRGTLTRPASAIPLVRNVAVFMLQYAVAVSTAMKLEPHVLVAIIGHSVSGASAGYFSGWTVALLRRYRSFDKSGTAEGVNLI
jgi:hypothetical protein